VPERTDISFDFADSPRIAQVDAGAPDLSIQDLLDTIRVTEDEFISMSFEKLANASGKDDLGGGLLVGITLAMQNLKVALEANRTPAQSGTATTGSSPPDGRNRIDLIDTAATFQANNVVRGSFVINFTDASIADVVEVISETQLRTQTLVNGFGNDFAIGDAYQVFNVQQFRVDGGNLVAVDDLDAVISAILPTAFTQILLFSDTSAALLNPGDLNIVKQMLAGNATITGDGPWSITVFDGDGITILETLTIAADKKTRTNTT